MTLRLVWPQTQRMHNSLHCSNHKALVWKFQVDENDFDRHVTNNTKDAC